MNFNTSFIHLKMPVYKSATWLFAIIFIGGNIVLPQLAHIVPRGGFIFLPIYFFTLIGAYKFGVTTGLATAVFSPLLNNLLFGMPPAFVLPIILIKSCLLAFIASYVAAKNKKLSPLLLLIVVAGYQIAGSLIEWGITKNFNSALQDFTIGLPGMLLQVVGGYLVLRKLAKYEF